MDVDIVDIQLFLYNIHLSLTPHPHTEPSDSFVITFSTQATIIDVSFGVFDATRVEPSLPGITLEPIHQMRLRLISTYYLNTILNDKELFIETGRFL